MLFISCLLIGTLAGAQNTTDLTRNITRAINEAQAEVLITVNWEKPVRLRDVMSRPPRMGANKNMILRYDKKTTSCKGILTNTGKVVTPAVCVQDDDFTLKKLTMQFSNGNKEEGNSHSFFIKEDVAFVRVSAESVHGLAGIPVAKIPFGQTLHETFGDTVTAFLLNFFQRHGIHRHVRRGIGYTARKPSLQVGDAVILDGKLVALIRKVPHVYSTTFFGSAPEDPLAIVY